MKRQAEVQKAKGKWKWNKTRINNHDFEVGKREEEEVR